MKTRSISAWLGSLCLLFATAAFAQQPTAPPQRPAQPEDELMAQMRTARNDPLKTVELLVRAVQEFPNTNLAESAGFSFANTLKRQATRGNDPTVLPKLAERFITGTAQASAPLRVRISSYALRALLDQNLTAPAIALARQIIPLLNEQAYLDFLRQGYERDIARVLKTNPNYKPRLYSEVESRDRFRQEQVNYHSLLGRALFQTQDLPGAEAAFKQAYDINHDMPAALGLANVLEKRGKDNEALPYMTEAMLTGKLDKAGLEQFQNLYRRTHGGKLDGVEEYLDARYRKSYRNPINAAKYSGTSQRTVLAEFFTGAGCIPCIPFDYTFEKTLETYARKDFILLVYHWHAPSLDPLGNRSTDARVSYYGIQGAPTTFLDGRRFKIEGGLDDTRVKSEAAKNAGIVYQAVTSDINRALAIPARVQLRLNATAAGNQVKAAVSIEGLKDTEATLHLALVEDEVHYSGENGLRFHPMVVRNLAKATGASNFGFNVAQAGNIEHVFDLAAITAENLRYYDEWPAERNKEVNTRIGGEADFDVGKFKEQRHTINPRHLSVVAFVQDPQTKQVLQAVYVKVKPSGTATQKAEQ